MTDDDWRFRKAQELGLIDTHPVVPLPRRDPAPLRPASSLPPERVQRTTAGASPKQDGPVISRALVVCGAVAFLLMAMAAGWFLRGRIPAALPMPVNVPAGMPAETAARLPAPAAVVVTDMPPSAAPAIAAAAPEVGAPPIAALPRLARIATPAPAVPVTAPVTVPMREPSAAPRRIAEQLAAPDAGPYPNPGFSCQGVQTSVNQMICNSTDLAAADARMARAYRLTVAGSDDADARRLDRDQAKFLNLRSACTSAACIAAVTRRRINALRR